MEQGRLGDTHSLKFLSCTVRNDGMAVRFATTGGFSQVDLLEIEL